MEESRKLKESLRELFSSGRKFSVCGRFLKETYVDRRGLIRTLSHLLLDPDCTLTLAAHVPYLLLELLFRASERQEHAALSVALGKLVKFFPDVLGFALAYFEKNPTPFWHLERNDDEPVEPKRRRGEEKRNHLEIVKACCNLLEAKCDYFKQKWDWSLFIETYLNHSQEDVRWLAGRCLALITEMTDSQQRIFELQLVEQNSAVHCRIEHQKPELNNAVHIHNSTVEEDKFVKTRSRNVISVCGINLPVWNAASKKEDSSFIMVDSTIANLRRLALAVSTGHGIYLYGPVGSGKTSLVEHLAKLTGRTSAPDFMKVQLGDDMDSKMLLGTYHCTDVPGEFLWEPGILTRAVMGGHWILLEDVDSAPADVAMVLTSLVETGTLSVPGYRDSVKAKPGFQLFVTQRSVTSRHSRPQNILHKQWLYIFVEPLSKEELVFVIKEKYPILQTVATRMVEVFLLFSTGEHTQGETSEKLDLPTRRRLTSTRDFMKWSDRAVKGFNVASQESALKVLQDAIDIFCQSVADPGSRLKLAVAVAARLGIVKTKAEYFCNEHKPTISLTTTHLSAGRTTLLRQTETASNFYGMGRKHFSLTRPAACLLESIACCVAKREPVLLVGETGTGKTTVVQHLADMTNHQLIVINMNQQSDSADLLGGYKPVDFKYVVRPIWEEFEQLSRNTFQSNSKFLSYCQIFFNSGRWASLTRAMCHVQSMALRELMPSSSEQKPNVDAKRRSWQNLGIKLHKLEAQLRTKSALAFTFIEGTLIKALQKGYWVLLDEINLASAETLECLSGLLEGSAGSLYLLERGDREPVRRHCDFQLFACMNPATDVGKKDLPAGLRNRFTEFFVDELTDKRDLIMLTGTYMQSLSPPASLLSRIVDFYLEVRREADETLTDGVGYRPHYSLRTLCRALAVAAQNKCGSVPRSLYEGLCLSFLSQLDGESHSAMEQAVAKKILVAGEIKGVLKAPLPKPAADDGNGYVNFEGYWVKLGKLEPHLNDKYILTSSVRRNLRDLVRVVALSNHPVLLQGETSVGKTSLITYLAAASGNNCVRINNHEHTDLQEYIGSYCANQAGQLVFKEGVLVEAMREGSWIILDELNLAPSDVLEALNRVLDDNRELFIPETQETVKAHPQFRLFATQNPPGLYGGRKVLSRAFQNRFVELHFGEIPADELITILHIRCEMPQSYCRKLVDVMKKLQLLRRGSATFAGKQGFMTLRDLFRWGERYRQAQPEPERQFCDWEQYVADEGFLLLAGRVRRTEEAQLIKEVIETHFRRTIDPQKLFTLSEETSPLTRPILEKLVAHPLPGFEHVVWTFNMRRLAVLAGKAIERHEPVLLVGETGCGKTTVCQMLAAANNQTLYTVNCHMHTESADFIGGLRPVRDRSITEQQEEGAQRRLFEWVDGPLIKAMNGGDLFLADEISLADDSVLERLNSLLEPERTLLLAEKGGDTAQVVVAEGSFQFIGTMNPGGDYGKKELSPALRNRFTEIWSEPVSLREDFFAIIEHNLKPGAFLGNQQDGSRGIGNRILDFLQWLRGTEVGKRLTPTVRDIMTWVNFINTTTVTEGDSIDHGLDLPTAYVNGACLAFLDSLGSGVTSCERPSTLKGLREASLKLLKKQVEKYGIKEVDLIGKTELTETHFGIHPFYIRRGNAPVKQDSFTFSAPTTAQNTLKVLRALQLSKPILLEGSPGTGKTSLVAAIAKIAGHHLVRINLSDQTDVSDLFGADLPVEGGEGGQFAWRDGPFLQALKAGHWILLDELNLASQSVLEGLNACLDHRGEVYVPELGRTFHIDSVSTRLFGTQNPLRQGGARRGLPQSFLNRFTQIFIDALTSSDLCFILSESFPSLPQLMIQRMVKFNMRLAKETGEEGLWGHRGGPWEMNLRDMTRWCQAIEHSKGCVPGNFVDLIYIDRMRTAQDRQKVKEIYEEEIGQRYPLHSEVPRVHLTPNKLYVGDVALSRSGGNTSSLKLAVLRKQFPVLRSLMRCVRMNWLSILVGPSGSGKTSVVQLLADLSGHELRVLCVNSAMDTSDILGGFEQADYSRELDEIGNRIEQNIVTAVRNSILSNDISQACQLLQHLAKYWKISSSEEQNFEQRLQMLQQLLEKLPASEEQQYMEQKLNMLKNETGTATTSGGKFRWVDSVLVKALRDGCWLLVDNVNLCSPAVLDRLNALLEPGGQLTIGERGVDADGNLISITPHPDFRIFLAMDPINGEISRAMRNRGVEIFLNEDLSQIVLDARALLTQQGLDHVSLQDALLCVHRDITQGQQNVERISQLLKAAFLLCQNMLHGRGALKSLQSACREVYQLENVGINSIRSSHSALPAPMSLSTQNVHSDSSLAMVYLQGAALLNKHLLGDVLPNLQIQYNIMPHLVIALYECTSINDLTLRHHWLNTFFAKDKKLANLSNTVYETMASLLPKVSENGAAADMSNLPWDLRHLPELVPQDYECSAQERGLTLLHFKATKLLLTDERVQQKTVLTVAEYSSATQKGQVREDITHATIMYFTSFLHQFDAFVESLLKSPRVTPVQSCFYLLLWRFRLGALAHLPLIQEGKHSGMMIQEAVSCLSVHYQWLFKWTIPVLNRMLQQDSELKSSSVVKKFEATSKTIKMSLPDMSSPLQKPGKVVLRLMGQPSPRSSIEYAELLLKLNRISDMLSIWQEDKPSWKSCVGFLNTQKGVQAWQTVVSAYSSLLPDGAVNFIEVETSLTQVEGDLEALKSGYSTEGITAVQLWPLKEFVVLLLSVALRRMLLEDKQSSVIEQNLKAVLCGLSSIPPMLATQLLMQDGKISMELLTNMLQHEKMSPATKHPKIWVTMDTQTNEDQNEATSSVESEEPKQTTNPLHSPALTVLATQLLLPSKDQVVTLGSMKSRVDLLSTLKQFLWRNMPSLSSDLLNYRKNEIYSAVLYGRRFLRALNRAVYNEEADPNIDVLLKVLYKDGNKQSQEFCKALSELHDAMSSIDKSATTEESGKWLVQVGQIWALLGYLQVILYTSLHLIDPVEKKTLKLQYTQEEITDLETKLQVQELQSCVLLGVSLKDLNDSSLHPRVKQMKMRLAHLQTKEKELSKYVAVRPTPPKYSSLSADILYFTQSLATREMALNLCNQLEMVAKQLCDPETKARARVAAEQLLLRARSWQESQETFCAKLRSEHLVWYPDITVPVLTAATMLSHGIKLLIGAVEKLMSPCADSVNRTLTHLIGFPSQTSEQHLDDCAELLHQVFVSEPERRMILEFGLLKAHLRDLRNNVMVQNELEEKPLETFFILIEKIAKVWEKEDSKRKQLKAEQESLYVIRCAPQDEEEQTEAEIETLFPSLQSKDFLDFEQSSQDLEESSEKSSSSDDNVELINHEDTEFIARLHSQIMTGFTHCYWLLPKVMPEARIDFVRPLLERFQVFSALLEKISTGADCSIDLKLLPSIIVIASAELSFAERGEEVSFVGSDIMKSPARSAVQEHKLHQLDFYHDSNLREAKTCLPVLNALASRVQELLMEWPEHPTLTKILVIVKRILEFPLTSPLARFQTGMELLLSHIYEWEENAHSGVSIAAHLSAVTSLIAAWRKLQLQSWRDCLSGVRDRLEQGAAKWWLHLYSLMQSFLNEKNPEEKAITSEDVLKTLKQFMEQSFLGEFKARLSLLLSFHCHVQHLQSSSKQKELMLLLWNVHKYYEQFSQTVTAMIDEQKAPIEKKLKDCVKIFRWEDKSYWAIKETIKKAHKTLHKHIKEYQMVLKQPVTLAISNFGAERFDVDTGRPQRNQKLHYQSLMASKPFLCSRKQRPKFQAEELGTTTGVLPKCERYFLKALDLSQVSIEDCPYARLALSVDMLVGNIIETYKDRSSLSVPDCDSTEFNKLAKRIVYKRKRALNDLFGTLNKLGLSYRTGLVKWQTGEDLTSGREMFMLPPIDLSASFNSISGFKHRRIGRELLSVWKGCENYFQRSIARLALLNTALQTPSKDLGSKEIDRCRGYSFHLMSLAAEQKLNLAENTSLLVLLRCYAAQLFGLIESDMALPSQSFIQEWMRRFKDLLAILMPYLEQLWVLVNACPSECNTGELPTLSLSELPPLLQSVKGDSIWASTIDKVHTLASSLFKLRATLEKSETTPQFFRKEKKAILLASFSQLRALEDGYNQMKSLAATVAEVRKAFECGPTEKSIIAVQLAQFEQRMLNEAEEFAAALLNTSLHDCEYTESDVVDFRTELEVLSVKTLLGIEVIYKEFASDEKSSEDETDDEEQEDIGELEDNHLVEKLVESLFNTFSNVNSLMNSIEQIMCSVTSKLQKLLNNADQRTICRRLLANYLPNLDQLLLLYEFLVTQQVATYRVTVKLQSILLVIFINLVQKGFCKPSQKPEIDEDSEGASKGGMGLAAGEGEKDVSECIESEEQLEEAKSQDAEKEQEDQDCKEEEKGIEMSEDFEGKLQDVGQEEQSDKEDSDKEMGKEMGDTAEDADTLDTKVWGSDSEEEESEPEQEDTEGGKGEKTGEKEIAAKDKQDTANEDEPGREEEDQKKQKKDINKMDEDGSDDDQEDPYHGQMEPHPEPDSLDLPDDMQLDDAEKPDDGVDGEDAENPFDIDSMKEQKAPEPDLQNKEDEENKSEEEKQEDIGGDENKPTIQDDEETDTGKEEKEDEGEIGKEDEHKPGEDPKEDNNQNVAQPSIDEPTNELAEKAEDMDRKFGSRDKVKGEDIKEEEIIGEEASGEAGDREQQGVGQSQMEEDSETGHSGKAAAAALSTDTEAVSQQLEKRPSQAEASEDRTLAEDTGPLKKRLRLMNVAAEEDEEKEEAAKESDWYQHVKETKDKAQTQTMDAATKEQAEKQLGQWSKEEQDAKENEQEEDMQMEDEDMEQVLTKTRAGKKKMEVDSLQDHKEKDITEEDSGEMVQTIGAARGNQDSAYYTSIEQDTSITSLDDMHAVRCQLEQQLETWKALAPTDQQTQKVWEEISSLTLPLARDLSEQLRLVLEPTRASRLKGDYRTGKRINMRKVIPYIASEFRKDKIWLRRTKPSKRQYQIVVAVDDSSSMADSRSKELAFESLALVTKALTLVEAGELAVVSFGKETKVLHPLGETFTEQSGAKLLQQLTFNQERTRYAELVRFATAMLTGQGSPSGERPAQLLIIVSDARGIQSEAAAVKQAVKYAKHAGILMVFIIIDNPLAKDSIMEMTNVSIIGEKVVQVSYMDIFPFPYYLVLKDISALPSVLSDALRQWFQLIANNDV